MQTLKTVIFDMDGLIFDTETLYYKANQAAADEMKLPFNWEYFERFVGSSEYALYKSLTTTFSSEKKARDFILRSEEIALDLMVSEEIKKKPGIDSLLPFLKENGMDLIIGSNSQRKIIELLLNKGGLTHFFNQYVGVDEVSKGKPAPDIYLRALEKTKTNATDALVLEDSINGVKAAHQANIPVIMVPDLEKPTDEVKKLALDVHTDLHEVHHFLRNKLKN